MFTLQFNSTRICEGGSELKDDYIVTTSSADTFTKANPRDCSTSNQKVVLSTANCAIIYQHTLQLGWIEPTHPFGYPLVTASVPYPSSQSPTQFFLPTQMNFRAMPSRTDRFRRQPTDLIATTRVQLFQWSSNKRPDIVGGEISFVAIFPVQLCFRGGL